MTTKLTIQAKIKMKRGNIMSKFYLVDTQNNVFTGFEMDENGNKCYCYQGNSDFRNSKHFHSIPAIEEYFKINGMPLYPTQHMVLEYNEDKERVYTHNF